MRCIPFAAWSFFVLCVVSASAQEELVGTWEGGIGDGGQSLRTVLHLALGADSGLVGSVDSPEQNVFGLRVSDLVFDDGAFAFRVPDTHAAWDGKLDPSGGRLTGIWKQRGGEYELNLERVKVDPLVGSWEGTADFGPLELRIVFHVGTRANGKLGASMVSPDQSSTHIKVTSVDYLPDGAVRFDAPSIGVRYQGRPADGFTRIEGLFTQGGVSYELNLAKTVGEVQPRRPQTPAPPFPYRAEDVTYPNAAAGNQLAGTLTLPAGDGPFPAVILITGSGRQDRNEEIFGHKPFLVIADFLTRSGIAVLRVDDRGVGGSTGDLIHATSEDFASDVGAGVLFLRAHADIRGDAIGLIGHSEGGMIAPMVAVARDDVAFLVLLAGLGIPGDELLFLQAALLSRAAGASDAGVEANRKGQAELFALLHTEAAKEDLRGKAREILLRHGGEAALAQLDQVTSAWFRYFVRFDPAPTLRQVTCPVLALNGSKDLQVPAKENLAAIAAALEAGGNKEVEIKEYPGLNHLFQHCEHGTIAEYGLIEETISPEVLADMAAWIGKQVSRN